MSQFMIEIVKGYEGVESREISTEKGKRTIHNQAAYMHCGEPFPQKIKLSLESPEEKVAVGKYTLKPSAFTSNQYGALSVDSYNVVKNLEPVK